MIQTIATGALFPPTGATVRDLNGIIWAGYERVVGSYLQIFCGHSPDNGLTWIEEQVSDTAGHQRGPAVAVDSQGNVSFAWTGEGYAPDPRFGQIQFRKRTPSGWEPQESITSVGLYQAIPSMAVNSQDEVELVWGGMGWGDNPGTYNIQYRKRTSTGWLPQEAITDYFYGQGSPSIAIGLDDEAQVAWSGNYLSHMAHPEIHYRRRTALGWQAREQVTYNGDLQWSPRIAVDLTGNSHVVWYGDNWGLVPMGNHSIVYNRRDSGGTWSGPIIVAQKSSVAYAWQEYPSVGLDISGKVYVSWRGLGWGANPDSYNILLRRLWEQVQNLTDDPYAQDNPCFLYSIYPRVGGQSSSIPESGFAIAWQGWDEAGRKVELYTSPDLVWPGELPPPEPRTLIIDITGEGTTNPAPGTYLVDDGAILTITAYPASGWLFDHWEGDVSGTNPVLEVQVLSDLSIVAVFVEAPVPPPTYILTIETVGQGTTDPASGSWEYPEGAEVLVSAIPTASWAFDRWEGDISSIENPVSFNITSDMRIVAVFSEVEVPPEQHSVSISVIGQGTTDPEPGTFLVDDGAILTITAYPASGWRFDHWEGNISGTANPIDAEVLTDISVVAVFIEEVVPPPKPFPWVLPVVGAVTIIAVVVAIARGKGRR